MVRAGGAQRRHARDRAGDRPLSHDPGAAAGPRRLRYDDAAGTPGACGPAARLDADADASEFFGSVAKPISIDSSVLERSKNVTVLAGKFGWDDVGTWAALGRVGDKDEFGNVTSGNVHMLDSADNVVHVNDGRVVMYGVDNLVVVVHDGLTLVTTTEKAADLKRLIESLPSKEKGDA